MEQPLIKLMTILPRDGTLAFEESLLVIDNISFQRYRLWSNIGSGLNLYHVLYTIADIFLKKNNN